MCALVTGGRRELESYREPIQELIELDSPLALDHRTSLLLSEPLFSRRARRLRWPPLFRNAERVLDQRGEPLFCFVPILPLAAVCARDDPHASIGVESRYQLGAQTAALIFANRLGARQIP